jgi:hypothetical protein
MTDGFVGMPCSVGNRRCSTLQNGLNTKPLRKTTRVPITAQFFDKIPIVDRPLPNSSATGASPWVFSNGLGALNQDVRSLHA